LTDINQLFPKAIQKLSQRVGELEANLALAHAQIDLLREELNSTRQKLISATADSQNDDNPNIEE
jgi:uncharacterized coiled-coil protein SlyX